VYRPLDGPWRPWSAAAGWWRDNSNKARAGVITPLALMTIAIVVSAGSGNSNGHAAAPKSHPVPKPVHKPNVSPPKRQPPPAAPRSSEITAAERAWALNAAEGSDQVAGAMNDIADKSQDMASLLTDDDTRIEFAADLATLQMCAKLLRVNGAPTARTRALAKPVREACRHYAKASTMLARGLDNLDANLIQAAIGEMSSGTAATNRATRGILAFQAKYG
jgi:hypothetical protein